jgi:hypothetical protein
MNDVHFTPEEPGPRIERSVRIRALSSPNLGLGSAQRRNPYAASLIQSPIHGPEVPVLGN